MSDAEFDETSASIPKKKRTLRKLSAPKLSHEIDKSIELHVHMTESRIPFISPTASPNATNRKSARLKTITGCDVEDEQMNIDASNKEAAASEHGIPVISPATSPNAPTRKSARLQTIRECEVEDEQMNVDEINKEATSSGNETEKTTEAILRRTRGPKKMKVAASHIDGHISVQWNSLGQPIGPRSVSLSSFLGPLAREMIPYTLDNWRKLSQGLKDVIWKAIKVQTSNVLLLFF